MSNKNIDFTPAISAAVKMRDFSYAVYSGYRVGTALVCKNGKIYTGCNVENSAFSPSLCAERTAFAKAISEGEKAFKYIVVAAGKTKLDFAFPCGVCLQVMSEFCSGDFKIVLAKNPLEYKIFTLRELMPLSFRLED